MPTYIRVKDLPNAATSPAADDFILLSGTANGARKISRSDFIAAIASQIVAAPSTYKIATLDGADKLTSSQDPSQSVSYLGGHDMVANSPALADGSGTAGDTYYVTNPGTRNYGSGNITAQEGDALVYSGSVWQLVEGIANILDGISTASTARTTLSVNSKDEDAQANALKVTAPALYFNGSSSYVTVADDDRFSFTDGVDDLPFSVSGWVNISDTGGEQRLVSKYGVSGALREYYVTIGGASHNALMRIYSTSASGYISVYSPASSLPTDQWCHVAIVYKGSGPNSSVSYASAFSDATQVIEIYINGVAQSGTQSNLTDFGGMTNTSQPVYIGKDTAGNYLKGSIRDVKIFNRTLTATEIAQLARGNDLGFVDEWGGAFGGEYTSDFTSDSTDSWTAANTTFDAASTVGGDSDNLKIVANSATATHTSYRSTGMVFGKRYRLSFDYYLPSGQSNVDGLQARAGSGGQVTVISLPAATQDAWTRVSGEFVNTATTNPQLLYMYITDAGNPFFTDAGADDYVAIRNVTITEIGTLADFRAERYDTSTSKLYDISDNAFVGTGTSVSLTGREQPVYETGTWTPSITLNNGSTGITYGTTYGTYTRIGDTVFVSGKVTLTSKGSETGIMRLLGLPFTAYNGGGTLDALLIGEASSFTGLTGSLSVPISKGTTEGNIRQMSSTGMSYVLDTNLTNTSVFQFSGTYKIQ